MRLCCPLCWFRRVDSVQFATVLVVNVGLLPFNRLRSAGSEIMPRRKRRKFIETDHLCRHCSVGPIMQQVDSGPSGGGNPYFLCVVCGEGCSSLGASALCFCGLSEYDGSQIHNCFRRGDDLSVPEGWKEVRLYHQLGVLKRTSTNPEATNG